MISKTYPLGSFERYPYVVILSRMEGKFLLSRHKQRTTWEFQGGHIEQGETPLPAAKRERRREERRMRRGFYGRNSKTRPAA